MRGDQSSSDTHRLLPAIDIDPYRETRLRWVDQSPKEVFQNWAYFFQGEDGGPIKIGCTQRWPGHRLKQAQVGYPFSRLRVVGLILGGFLREHDYHERFRHLRMESEWFRPEQELLDFIRSLPPPKDPGSIKLGAR